MKNLTFKKGFTLTEILVVVAIISLLAAIGMVAYGKVKTRATAVAWTHQLEELETAFKTYRQYELPDGWPDLPLKPASAPKNEIENILDGNAPFSNFDQYFPGEVIFPDWVSVKYVFDETEPFDNCVIDHAGVNIRISAKNPSDESRLKEIFEAMNKIIDNDLPNKPSEGGGCGKISLQGSSNSVYYLISETKTSN